MKAARKRNILIERKRKKRTQAKIAHQDPSYLRKTQSKFGAFGKCHYAFNVYPSHADLRRLKIMITSNDECFNLLKEKKIGWILNHPKDDQVIKLVIHYFN